MDDPIPHTIIGITCAIVGLLFGATLADQGTINACASKGTAPMARNVTIECKIVREKQVEK